MCYLEERPIRRIRNPVYEIALSVYPVALCGSDLQKGNPLEVSEKGEDLYSLKTKVEEMILSAMSSSGYDGECFVEMLVYKDTEYYDRDEHWVSVDLVNKKVKVIAYG